MGLAVVQSLVDRGWKVAIIDKDRQAGEQVAKRHSDQIFFFDVDVTDYEQQAAAFARTWSKWGRIDLGKKMIDSRETILICYSLCQRRMYLLYCPSNPN